MPSFYLEYTLSLRSWCCSSQRLIYTLIRVLSLAEASWCRKPGFIFICKQMKRTYMSSKAYCLLKACLQSILTAEVSSNDEFVSHNDTLAFI